MNAKLDWCAHPDVSIITGQCRACKRVLRWDDVLQVGVVGSRRFANRDVFDRVLGEMLPKGARIVSGGARGPDTWAALYGFRVGHEVIEFAADWGTPCLHESACKRRRYDGSVYYVCKGFERNAYIVDASDVVLAFVADDRTGGTEDTIKMELDLGFRIRTTLVNCRLAKLNAPELVGANAAAGEAARDYLASLVAGRTLHVHSTALDKYGRPLVVVSALQSDGSWLNVNDVMLASGHAVPM